MEKTKLIPMSCDMVFKKMWGDPDNIDRLSALLSIILGIPYEKLRNRIEIIDSEKKVTNKAEKRQRFDILAKVKLSLLGKVNLEMNIGFDQTDIDRNTSYISHIFSSNIRSGEDYADMETVFQINFNDYDICKENEDIIDKYYYMNKNFCILTEKLQIYHINIAKCKNIWYNEDIKKYNKLDQQVIRLCTLMTLTDEEEFRTCIGEIDMDELVKKDIEEVEQHLSADDEILAYYGSEEDLRKLELGKIKNAERRGIEQGYIEKTMEIARNMLLENIDLDTISRITKLTKEEINSLSKD